MKTEDKTPPEILSLNLDDLDVEELERRIEMVAVGPLDGVCYSHSELPPK